MDKNVVEKTYRTSRRLIQDPIFLSIVSAVVACGTLLYVPEVLALSEGNKVAELKTLTEETSKIVKNFSHLIGLGSIGVGLFAMVQSQNLKVAATAAVITLAAFKGPDFFTTTALI